MLETPNARASEIFPVWLLPCGDDGKRKPFQVVHCLASPACSASLRISPGRHSRLPPECVAKFATQKGWLCDKRGYALCPEHKPGAHHGPRSDMPPHQKRAAFLAIRDRNLAEAAARMMKPAKPVGSIAAHVAKVRAGLPDAEPISKRQARAERRKARAEALATPANRNDRSPLRRRIMALIAEQPNRVWRSRRETAKAWGIGVWNFQDGLVRAIRQGFVVQEPIRPGTDRPFRLRLVDKFDPPAMQPEPEESAMEPETVDRPAADPPRQPTREDNRRIRDYLDSNFDELAGRYRGDLSDHRAAERLSVPRAWVSAIRSSLYGDDRNEADEAAVELGTELVADAIRLKDDALGIATRAEEFERRCRAFLAERKR